MNNYRANIERLGRNDRGKVSLWSAACAAGRARRREHRAVNAYSHGSKHEPREHGGPDSWFDPTEVDYAVDQPDDPDNWIEYSEED